MSHFFSLKKRLKTHGFTSCCSENIHPQVRLSLNTNVQNVNWDNREIYKTFSLKIMTKFSSSCDAILNTCKLSNSNFYCNVLQRQCWVMRPRVPSPKTDLRGNFFIKWEAPLEGTERGKNSPSVGVCWSSSLIEGALSSLKLQTSFVEGCKVWVHNSQGITSCFQWSLNLHGWNLCGDLNWPLGLENSWNYSGAGGVKKDNFNTLDFQNTSHLSHLSGVSRMEYICS